MSGRYRGMLAALTVALPLTTVGRLTAGPAVASVQPRDVLSGTWRVTRTCLTVCVSPKPVLRKVRRRSGNVYMTDAHPPQVLYQTGARGTQVLVYGGADASILTIDHPGQLMSGSGVGADGRTFTTTWRCVAAAGHPIPPSATQPDALSATASRSAPAAIEVC